MAQTSPDQRVPYLFYPVAIPATSSPGVVPIGGAVLLGGWSFTETTGTAPATVAILYGGDQNGARVCKYNLNPGQSVTDIAPGLGILLRSGIFVAVLAGTVDGSIWIEEP